MKLHIGRLENGQAELKDGDRVLLSVEPFTSLRADKEVTAALIEAAGQILAATEGRKSSGERIEDIVKNIPAVYAEVMKEIRAAEGGRATATELTCDHCGTKTSSPVALSDRGFWKCPVCKKETRL